MTIKIIFFCFIFFCFYGISNGQENKSRVESDTTNEYDEDYELDSTYNEEPDDKPELKSILVYSIPDHANVFVNDSLYGQTPLEYTFRKKIFGTVFIDLVKEGYKKWEYSYINPPKENIKIVAVLDSVYGIIRVNSRPSGASVFINDSLVGVTPLNSLLLKHGEHNIRITKNEYEDFTGSFDLQSKLISLNAELLSKYTTLTNSNISKPSKVFIDTKEVNVDSLNNYRISTGLHGFEIIDLQNQRYLRKEVNLMPQYNYNLGIQYNKFTLTPLGLSAIVPGLGQLYNGAKLKGVSFFLGTVLTGILSGIAGKSYNDKLNNYNDAQDLYLKSTNENEAISRRSFVNTTYSEAKNALNYKRVAIGSLIVIYAINLVDVILNESFKDHIDFDARIKPSYIDYGPFPDSYNFKLKFNMQFDY